MDPRIFLWIISTLIFSKRSWRSSVWRWQSHNKFSLSLTKTVFLWEKSCKILKIQAYMKFRKNWLNSLWSITGLRWKNLYSIKYKNNKQPILTLIRWILCLGLSDLCAEASKIDRKDHSSLILFELYCNFARLKRENRIKQLLLHVSCML